MAEAEGISRQIVDDTVERFLAGYPTSDDGLGEHPCDPIENGEVSYDYGLEVEVPADKVQEATSEIWAYWQREYGFEPHSESFTFEPPVVRAGSHGFGGSITGDPERDVVFVGISSPCFSDED